MPKLVAYLPIVATLLVATIRCTSETKEGLGEPTGSTCPADSTLTWATFGSAFIETNCARCHDEETPRIVTQADVQAHLSLIDRAAAAGPDAENTYMPEDEGLPTSERRKLGEWLACGAP